MSIRRCTCWKSGAYPSGRGTTASTNVSVAGRFRFTASRSSRLPPNRPAKPWGRNLYERIAITHLLTDANDAGRIAGAIGFAVRENAFYVFKAKAVIIASGGSSNVFRPRSTEEGLGRTWYSVFAPVPLTA